VNIEESPIILVGKADQKKMLKSRAHCTTLQ
jgi:hypothetical protein